MAPNKSLPHLFLLPEDDANRQVADAFWREVPFCSSRQVQVLPEAGGWGKVLDSFVSDHVRRMSANPNGFMVLLMDFDGSPRRLDQAKTRIPRYLLDRVFVLGAWSEPEELKPSLGSFERIGQALAQDCRDEKHACWSHALLEHNAPELERLYQRVRPFLFPPG